MRQRIKNTFVMVSMVCLIGAVGFMPRAAWAVAALPVEISPSEGDNEKMAADLPESSDSDSVTDQKPKKPHKSKRKMTTKETDDIVAGKEDDAGALDMQGDSRIKMLLYDEADVYTITTRYGYQTNVVFSPQEEIELVSVGDRSLWQIIPSGHRLFIRPMEEDVITNMTVLTNKRSYQFDLKSLPSGKSGNIYVAQFVYGNPKKPDMVMDTPASAMPMQQGTTAPAPAASPVVVAPTIPGGQAPVSPPQSAMPQPLPAAAANYSYTYSGPDEMAPLQVYDDGQATYVKYNNVNKLAPTAFIVDPSGKEMPVSYNIQGDYMVIDRVVGELAIKSNGSVIHVFNEMINPG